MTPEYYNGADIVGKDSIGLWTLSAKIYLNTLKNYGALIVTNYHPELDNSALLGPDQIKIYQRLIRCAQ